MNLKKYRVDGKYLLLLGHWMLYGGGYNTGTTASLGAHELCAFKLCNISDVGVK
jgi:hypothetical protein